MRASFFGPPAALIPCPLTPCPSPGTDRRLVGRGESLSSSFGFLNHRAASIGVSVKLTNMLMRMVAAIVTPNDFRNRPTMPSIMAIGRNTAISDRVMAMTASPISPVAAIAAS